MRSRRRIALPALAAALVLALALAVLLLRPASRSQSAPSAGGPASGFDGAALPASVPVRDFTLTSLLTGRQVSLQRYEGQVSVLAFPYSTCEAPCTLLAQQIRGAIDELPRPVPVLFVSADPAADSRASVEGFLARVSLTGRVQYLTGSASQLRSVWREYGVAPASAGRAQYLSHVAVFLLDRQGAARVVFGLEQLTPEGLAHDICKLEQGCS